MGKKFGFTGFSCFPEELWEGEPNIWKLATDA